jgi:hypothetical protein
LRYSRTGISECDQSRCWNFRRNDSQLECYHEGNEITSKLETAAQQNDAGPLQALVDMVPDNAVAAMSNNSLMPGSFCHFSVEYPCY